MDQMNLESLKEKNEEAKKRSRQSKKTVIAMLIMVGANIVTPKEVIKPLVDEVESNSELKDAYADIMIALHKLTPAKANTVLKAALLDVLDQKSLLEFSSELSDINTDVMTYCFEHKDICKSGDEVAKELAEYLTTSLSE